MSGPVRPIFVFSAADIPVVFRVQRACISLVLVARFGKHRYPLPPIGVDSIYMLNFYLYYISFYLYFISVFR